LKLTPDSLATQLTERLLPAYLISGDEPLLVGEAADAVRARARALGFTEREVYFTERASDWDEVRGAAASRSLFGTRRILEIRMPSGRPGVAGAAALLALLGARDPETLLLILAPRLDRDAQNSDWVRAADAAGAWVQVWAVDRERLVGWLRGRARKLGLELNDEAFELLAARTEGNLLAAQQELQKLALLTSERKVAGESVLASTADSARFDVFQLSDAALAGDAPRALRILAGLRAEGTEPTLVLWGLTKALRDVWSARAATARAAPPPWQRQSATLARALERAPRLSFTSLAQRAARVDRMIKGRTTGDPWDEMALLASEFCARPLFAPLRAS